MTADSLAVITEEIARALRGCRDTPPRRAADLDYVRDVLAPRGLRALDALVERLEQAEAALDQACMNLATIRPLDVMQPHEDLSLGECKERWRDLVMAQSASIPKEET